MEKLEKKIIDDIVESKILNYQFDMLNNKIYFELELTENSKVTFHKLVFSNVSTFYFVNDRGEDRKDFYPIEENSYLELTDLHLLSDNVKFILQSMNESWIKDFSSEAKIAIEIWDKLLLIEAKELEIDNVSFMIG